MKMTPDAKRSLDAIVERALGPDAAPAARGELESHLHAAAERQAASATRSEVSVADVETALAEAGGVGALARAFPAAAAPRAGFARRGLAYAIDVAAALGALLALWVVAWVPLAVAGGRGYRVPFLHRPDPFQLVDFDDLPIRAILQGESVPGLATGLALLAIYLALPVLAFAWLESRLGWTPGKRMLGLRVARPDGARVGLLRALVRNLPKAAPVALLPLALADALLIPGRRRQRGLDRLADTVVLRAE